MMRALVLLAVLALASCRSNPSFHLLGDRSDESSGDSGAETDAESSTGEPACDPVHLEPADLCEPGSEDVPLYYLSEFTVAEEPMLADRACTDTTELLVKRVGQELHACTRCDQPCDPALSMDVAFPAMTALISPLLPAEGECAWLWHLGADNPDPTQSDCRTVGFALRDADERGRLRVAVAFNHDRPDPFAGVGDSPLSVTVTDQSPGGPCSEVEGTRCEAGGYVAKQLAFEFGGCSFTTHQGVVSSGLRVDGLDYILETHSAHDCIDGPTTYRWWLRRE